MVKVWGLRRGGHIRYETTQRFVNASLAIAYGISLAPLMYVLS